MRLVKQLKCVCLFICILLLSACHVTTGHKENVTYVKTIDGDTVVLMVNNQQEKVRLLFVDTPESVKPNTPIQRYSLEAKQFTQQQLERASQITIVFDTTHAKRDKYNRLLAHVFVDEALLSLQLVEKGFAKVRYAKGNETYYTDLLQAQQRSKEKGIGIWSIGE